jgi:VWFA-related protein
MVDLVAVDVQAVSRDGDPVDGLNIDDFQVFFDGHPRRVISVDFLRKAAVPPPDEGGPERPIVTPGYVPPGARLFVLAVDTVSFANTSMKAVVQGAQSFLDQLQPDDLVALYVYPFDRPELNFTHDHRAVRRALDRISGQREAFPGAFHLSVSEVIDINANDGETIARVFARECQGEALGGRPDPPCLPAIHAEANAQAAYYESQGTLALRGLALLLQGLQGMSDRKTVVLLSGGMAAGDRVGGRPDLGGAISTVGAEAGAADTSVYVLHMDDSFFDAFSSSTNAVRDPGDRTRSSSRDSYLLGRGLDQLAGSAGGALLRVQAGSGALAFGRILRESSAYYLLGVAPAAEDRDGKLHFLRVSVKKRGVTVRTRTHVVIPRR